jgi:hypothetical protein
MSRRVMFFATRDDLLRVLGRVEQSVPLTYRAFVTNGPPDFGPLHVPTWGTAAELPALGTAAEGDIYRQPSYLLMPAASPFTLRVREAGGRTLRGVYPEGNPDSAMFYPGGLYNGACLVGGEFSVGLPKPAGFDLLGALRRALQAEFERVPDSFVGPCARELAVSGLRLVGSTWQPPEVDFKLPVRQSKHAEPSAAADPARKAGPGS